MELVDSELGCWVEEMSEASVEVKAVFFFMLTVKFEVKVGGTEERAVSVGNPHPLQMAKGAKKVLPLEVQPQKLKGGSRAFCCNLRKMERLEHSTPGVPGIPVGPLSSPTEPPGSSLASAAQREAENGKGITSARWEHMFCLLRLPQGRAVRACLVSRRAARGN